MQAIELPAERYPNPSLPTQTSPLKSLNPSPKILQYIRSKHIRIRKIIQIGQALVFDPGDVQAGFVAFYDFFLCEFAPAAFGLVSEARFLCVCGYCPDGSIR